MNISIILPLAGEYFPRAHDDMISVWEDQSITVNTVENDYFAGQNTTIIGFSDVRLSQNKYLLQSSLRTNYGFPLA